MAEVTTAAADAVTAAAAAAGNAVTAAATGKPSTGSSAASGATTMEEYMILTYIIIPLAIFYLVPIVLEFIHFQKKKAKWSKLWKRSRSVPIPDKST